MPFSSSVRYGRLFCDLSLNDISSIEVREEYAKFYCMQVCKLETLYGERFEFIGIHDGFIKRLKKTT